MAIDQKVQDYKKMLDLFPNAQEKYQYLIEQAKDNTNFPEELRNDHFKVSGCQSQVWLIPEEKDEKVYSIKPNFGNYHLTNSEPSCLKTQLELPLSRI